MHFAPGQKYQLSGFEPESTATICRVDESLEGSIVHVRFDGLHLSHPYAPGGYLTTIVHMAFAEEALSASLSTLLSTSENPGEWEEAYSEWREAYEKGQTFIWELPVYDALQVHQTMTLKL